MPDSTLQEAVEEITPRLTELAQNLGRTPGEVLRELVEERRKQWACSQLDAAVAKAEASGFHEVNDFDQGLDGIKAEARARCGD